MTALKWDLIQNNDKIALQLSGELSRNTLLPLWQQRASFLSEKQNNQSLIEFDLTEINRIDSAGFALLCDFLHDCEQLPNKKVRLINPPEQLLTLADLVNLSHWISTFIDKRWHQKCPPGEKLGERPPDAPKTLRGQARARVFDGASAARSSSRFFAMRSLLCAARNDDYLFASAHGRSPACRIALRK